MHETFRFKNLTELQNKVADLNLSLKFSENLSSLKNPLKIEGFNIPNRIVIHPMEGCDGRSDGSPSELTLRRYSRFGQSGAGLVWYEANAVKPEGRANPRQIMLTEENKNKFKKILDVYEEQESKLPLSENGFGKTLKILQLTHSGRYSRPGKIFPQRMYYYDALDKAYHQQRTDGSILSDEDLLALPDYFLESARLAKEIGFDGVDIKTCHRYLLNESLSAFTRENSQFGGESFENRTRLLKNIFDKIIPAVKSNSFLITLRLNIYDAVPYPYGFGVVKESYSGVEDFTNRHLPPMPDLSEPIELLKVLYEKGIRLANITIANPYFNPYISRPYDVPLEGISKPNEHPLIGVDRFINLTSQVKKVLPDDLRLIGTGYSWLRQYGPNVAAGEILSGHVDLVGWGRMAFANPEFPKQIILNGSINSKKTCITCSKCTELMRKKSVAGCVIRDNQMYLPYFKGEKKPDWE